MDAGGGANGSARAGRVYSITISTSHYLGALWYDLNKWVLNQYTHALNYSILE